MVKIFKKNNTYLKIECERHISKHMSDFFSFFVENYKFHPAYKRKQWDGRIRLWSTKTNEIYVGLLEKIISFMDEFNYSISHVDKELFVNNAPSDKSIADFINTISCYTPDGELIENREYQDKSIAHCIKNPRSLLLSPTSSGKSLMIYYIVRWYQEQTEGKILIVVPTVNLTTQLYSDFEEYSLKDSWSTEKNTHKISAGIDKETKKKIVISTWQSIFNQPQSYFNQFEMLIVDEVHLATAKGLTGIAEKTINCHIKIGCTGTLKEAKCNKAVLEGLFGPVFVSSTTKELMDANFVSNLEVNCLLLGYSKEIKKIAKKAKYPDEINFLINNKNRNTFIRNLAIEESKEKNCLILFNLKAHGEFLYKICSEYNKNTHLIYGKTLADDRESIRKYTSKTNGNILIASYGVFSTGANIPNLQSLIFAHPYKSEIKNLQSIGRVLRLDGKDDKAVLFDLADDLSSGKWENYTLQHWKKRVGIYSQQKFNYKIYPILL